MPPIYLGQRLGIGQHDSSWQQLLKAGPGLTPIASAIVLYDPSLSGNCYRPCQEKRTADRGVEQRQVGVFAEAFLGKGGKPSIQP